ncbi:septal ring lytic transglycosylase RlpA family protein [Pararhodospirillum photometricum]|nr:septal ring lytic transglycosylase RlpA family protein [Pararhodospirillum photometricum]
MSAAPPRRLLLWGVLGLSCFVAACAETPSGGPATGGGARPSGEGGTYKIGKPYQIGGRWYYPREDYDYNEVGEASWYGSDFHGKRTANGEVFDQDRLSAAHTILPLPSIVQVTNLANGRSIIVRVNDRGPFVNDRIIDMSRAAARALGFERAGRTKVRVQVLAWESRQAKAQALSGTAVAEAPPVAAPRGTVETVALDSPPPRARVERVSLPPSSSSSRPAPASASRGAAEARAPVTGWATGPAGQDVSAGRDVPARDTWADAPEGSYVQIGAFASMDNAKALQTRLRSLGPAKIAPVNFGDHVLYRVRLGPFPDADTASQILRNTQASGYPEARIVAD